MKKILFISLTALALNFYFNIQSTVDNEQLLIAVHKNDIKLVDQLFTQNQNLDPNYVYTKTGNTLLNLAASKGYTEMVKALLRHGANINIKGENLDTPLYSASVNKNKETVKALLEAGADSNITNKDGNTPLIISAVDGYEDIARILLDKGANINTQTLDGRTALHWAIINEHPIIMELLLSRGADMNIKDEYGDSPLDLVEEKSKILALKANSEFKDVMEGYKHHMSMMKR